MIRVEVTRNYGIVGAFFDDADNQLSAYIPTPVLLAAHKDAGVSADSNVEIVKYLGDYIYSTIPVTAKKKRKVEVVGVKVIISQYLQSNVVLSHTIAVDQIDITVTRILEQCPTVIDSVFRLAATISFDLHRQAAMSTDIESIVTAKDVSRAISAKELKDIGISLDDVGDDIYIAQSAINIKVLRSGDSVTLHPDINANGVFKP